MKLRVLELFAGIGACSKALERLEIEHEIVDAVEIDKYAVKSFNAMHNTNFEPQDICEWDKDIEVDLIMHGSPYQDFSLAGKQAGGDKDSGTRSSLMYETIRIVEKLRPKYVIWENVKNLLSKKHIHNFNAYLETMEQLGYTNYYQVLNAKDYGIPQNRERVFTISVLGNDNYEFLDGIKCDNEIKVVGNYMPSGHNASRIVDENGIAPTVKENHGTVTAVLQRFEFPPKQELKLKLKDMLEEEVDEKYYLSEKMMNYVLDNNETQKGTKWEGRADNDTLNSEIAHTLSVRGASGSQRAGVSNFIVDDYDDEIKVKDIKLKIKEATKLGYKEAYEGDGVNIGSRMKYQRGNVQKDSIQTLTTSGGNERGVVVNKTLCLNSKGGRNGVEGLQPSLKDRIYDSNGIATCCATSNFFMPNYTDGLRIRKLTPKESFRLMGFDDEDFEKASKVNSNTQLYKQAGNSIVVNVLEAILTNLLK